MLDFWYITHLHLLQSVWGNFEIQNAQQNFTPCIHIVSCGKIIYELGIAHATIQVRSGVTLCDLCNVLKFQSAKYKFYNQQFK